MVPKAHADWHRMRAKPLSGLQEFLERKRKWLVSSGE